jgi:hypothetical protein
MTEADYKIEMAKIETERRQKREEVMKKFAFENNTVKSGDKFTDHIGTIVVEQIKATLPSLSEFPSCMYFGIELKKDGTPKKDGSKRWTYQTNKLKD